MKEILILARDKYKVGDRFLSATGLLKTPCRVQGLVRWSEFNNCIVSDGMGVLYDFDSDSWAEILE